MFKKLADFKYKRTFIEALGFYLVYVILAVIAGASLGALVALFGGDNSLIVKLAITFAVIYCAGLGYIIAKAKKLTKNTSAIVLCILAGVLAPLGGAVLGLIPVAYLSSK